MREHMGLFRGKRIDTGDWVEGNLVNYNPHFEWVHITYFAEDDGGFLTRFEAEVIPDSIGECAGVKDKNGKTAFEHDITEDQWGRRWIIFGCEGGFGICRDTEWAHHTDGSVTVWNALADAQNAEWFSHQHKIIGNVTDNPDLLKGGESE